MARRACTLVPVGMALVLYAGSLRFDRTFDDIHQITAPDEPVTRTLGDMWTQPYWQEPKGGGLYRPVTSSTYWVEARWGLPLWFRHLVNVGLHAAVAGLVARVALALGLGAVGASLAGTLFALHPTHVEAVAGLVGRAELLAAGFLLLFLLLYDRLLSGPDPATPKRAAPGAWACLLLGVLAFLASGSKESAWLLPPVAAGWALARRRSMLRPVGAWAAMILGIGAHLVLRHRVLGGWLNAPEVVIQAGDNPLVALHGVDRIAGGLRVLGLNLTHLVLPWRMSPDYSGDVIDVGGTWTDPRLWAGVVFLGGATLLAAWGYRRRERPVGAVLCAAGSWLAVSAVFSLNLFLDLGTVLADRLLLWPSIGWALILAGIASPGAPTGIGAGRGAALRRAAPVAALGLAYLGITAAYLPAWRNDATLFAKAVQTTPASPRVWFNHGRALQDAGRLDEALSAYQEAKRLAPDDYQVWAQEAAIFLQMGRPADAESALARALSLEPEDPVSRVNEGILWMERGETERAAERFREVMARHPERVEALMNLALAEGRLGRHAEAETHWRAYLEKQPGDASALNNLAWLLATARDRPAEAESLARQAVARRPEDPNFRDTLAEAIFRQGRAAEAAAVAREALALEPGPELEASLRRFTVPDSASAPPRN